MRRRLALLLATAVLGGAAVASAPVAASPPAPASHCSSRYVNANLSWGHKCLAAGQFCKRSGDREYHRYGFHCHRRDSRGNYHLTR